MTACKDKQPKSALRGLLTRLRGDTSGLALIEFAMTLPVISLLGMGGMELANYAVTNLRISQAAMHIADNASRIGDRDMLTAQQIYESDIEDLFIGVRMQAGTQTDLYENGRVILSSLERNTDDGQWIHWQRCMGKKNVASAYGPAGTGMTGTGFAGMGPTGEELKAVSGGAVMYVEIVYDYQPLIDNAFTSPFTGNRTISTEAAFMVRNSRDLDGIFQRPTPSTVHSCDKFDAI